MSFAEATEISRQFYNQISFRNCSFLTSKQGWAIIRTDQSKFIASINFEAPNYSFNAYNKAKSDVYKILSEIDSRDITYKTTLLAYRPAVAEPIIWRVEFNINL